MASSSIGPTALVQSALRNPLLGLLGAALLFVAGCDRESPPPPSVSTSANHSAEPPPASENKIPAAPKATMAEVPNYTYEVVNVLPHDPTAFTQGLVFIDGSFLESTGLHGESTLRKVELKTGKVVQRVNVPAAYFAEGLAVIGTKAFQLTWQDHKGFVYDLATLRLEKEFRYEGEGWGLTTDGHSLILSDGTDQIKFLDPVTFELKRTIRAFVIDHPSGRLNELEYVNGEIFANVWGSDYVLRIDPETGRVTGIIDFSGLLPPEDRNPNIDVFNGIAYDAGTDRLFVTGKRWPKVFEVRLKLK